MTGAAVLVGLTTSLEEAVDGDWRQEYGMVPAAYLRAVEAAGGAPVLLPPQPDDAAVVGRVLDAVDALVLTGGVDVDPARYGATRDARTEAAQPSRDAWELALLAGALERRTPVLAICRGVQVLNVALGGTLVQHLPDATDEVHGGVPGGYTPTAVEVSDGTRLAGVLGRDGLTAPCHHHQAIDRVAPRLRVSARSAGGVVEAVELPGDPFVLGVQWHPEEDAADRRLFAAVVAAARSRSQ